MGIKYKIISELEDAEDGLTISELANLLGKTKPVIRTILNRDLKPKFVVEQEKNGLIMKRKGSKVYILARDEDGNVKDTQYLGKLHSIMEKRMDWVKMPTPEEQNDLKEIEDILGIKTDSKKVIE